MDELRLVAGATMDILLGEDVNRNGILDPNETDEDRDGVADPGLLEYVTVSSREPNTRSDGSPRIRDQRPDAVAIAPHSGFKPGARDSDQQPAQSARFQPAVCSNSICAAA